MESPPGVEKIVIEKLRQAWQKRTNYAHVLVKTRLIWNKWQKNMHKSADIILYIPAGNGYMHEMLILAINFPYLNRFP